MDIIIRKKVQLAFSVVLFLLIANISIAQSLTASQYLEQAKEAAFQSKDFAYARQLCKMALQEDSLFDEATIFLGRLYAWDKQYDSARFTLDKFISRNPKHEDALVARTDIAYWDKQYTEALHFCEQGLLYHPLSSELLLRKAKIYYAGKDYYAAKKAADAILQKDGGNTAARALANDLIDYTSHNRIGIRYDYYYFDKQFPDPWHVGSLDYSRQTKAGVFTGRMSFANRYNKSGWQWEAEAYPRISKTFYAFFNIGFSGNNIVFPKLRTGLSIYANLPKAWELEAGLRYLNFSKDVFVYTGSVGKYIGRYWLNGKFFLSPDNKSVSQSYFITGRFYYGKVEDYITLNAGSGISPDENRNIQLTDQQKLISNRIGAGIHHSFGSNIVMTNINWSRDEYLSGTWGNQLNIGIGYQRKF